MANIAEVPPSPIMGSVFHGPDFLSLSPIPLQVLSHFIITSKSLTNDNAASAETGVQELLAATETRNFNF